MLDRLLPRHIDNGYHGNRLALWLLAVIVIMKTGIALGTIFNGHSAATSADGIPLDTFSPAGEQAFLAVFAAWGLAQLMLNLVGALVLARYRALVPFMFALLLLEHLGRKLVFVFLPIVKTEDAPGFYINFALVAVMVMGLALSLSKRADAKEAR